MDRNLRSNQFLVVSITAWLSFNLIFRWLHTAIFLAAGPYGIPQPSPLDQLLVVVCSVFIAFIFPLIALCLGSFRGSLGRVLIAIYSVVSLLFIECDLGWYMMSKSHVTFGDVVLFATQNWLDHFGIQTHDIIRFCTLAMLHASVVAAIFHVNHRLEKNAGKNLLFSRISKLFNYRYIPHALLCLFLLGQGATMLCIGSRQPLWTIVAHANPYYLSAADEWMRARRMPPVFVRLGEEVNAERRRSARDEPASIGDVSAKTRPDILFVTVESWNANFTNAETMPYFSSLAKVCHVRTDHYSGGNQTELGVLSLLYGEPDVFFRGYRQYATNVKQSAYISALGRLGYRLSRVVSDASQQNTIPRYLAGFEPEVVDKDDWNNIQTIATRLTRPGPDFVHAHYFHTHYPYIHALRYSANSPETPPDFSFQSSDLVKDRGAITNRYKNTLGELDAWLKTLLGRIDLSRTIVVITGDHGEEMFETGRLGHAATLESPQVHTPLAICGPDAPSAGQWSGLSSHADIFPTVFDMIGSRSRLSALGRSLFSSEEPRLAIVAKQNHGKPPVEWAVRSDQGAIYLSRRSSGKLEVTGGDSRIQASLSEAGTNDGTAGVEQSIVRAIVTAEREMGAADPRAR